MASTTTPGNASATTATTTATTLTFQDILESKTLNKDEITQKLFDKCDKDNNGKINVVELHEIIKV